MKNVFLFVMFFCSLALSAWTERYVAADAAADGEGTALSPWTLDSAYTKVAAGDRVNIKAGTYLNTTELDTIDVNGTATQPIWWRGYNTTIGDLDTNISRSLAYPIDSFTTGRLVVVAAYNTISCLDIRSASTTTGGGFYATTGSNSCKFYSLRVRNTAANANSRAFSNTSGAHTYDCYFQSSASANCVVGTGPFVGCVFSGGLNSFAPGGAVAFDKCIFIRPAAACITMGNATGMYVGNGCTFYGPGTDALVVTTAPTTGSVCFSNSTIVSCGGYAVNNTSGAATDQILLYNVKIQSCNGGGTGLVFPASNGLTELTALTDSRAKMLKIDTITGTVFEDTAANNFSPAYGSGLRNAGFPGKYNNLTSTISYPDVGAVRHQDTLICAGGISAADSLRLKQLYFSKFLKRVRTKATGGDTLYKADNSTVLATTPFTETSTHIIKGRTEWVTTDTTTKTTTALIYNLWSAAMDSSHTTKSDSSYVVVDSSATTILSTKHTNASTTVTRNRGY